MSAAAKTAAQVPHQFDALLLDEVTRVSEHALEARMVVRSGTAFSDELGNLPAWVGPEIMAQAVSALAGHRSLAQSGRPAEIGLLRGVRSYSAPHGDFHCGQELCVSVAESSEDAGWAVFHCSISGPTGEILASGTLTVFQPPDGSFLEAECARDD
jgi:predicted hotdog family 3-hydroxylacyl-ACP dehydratase